MKLSGSYQINLPKEKVWEALNDPEILKQAIPGCEEFTKNSDTEFTAKATNKIGPFNASFTGDVELKDLNPPNSYKISGSGNSPVGFASGEASVKLEDENGGTKLIYEVEANVGGKIAQVGARLIDMTAKKMAIFFAVISISLAPTCAIFPPTFASTSYINFVPPFSSSNFTLASPDAKPTGEFPDPEIL